MDKWVDKQFKRMDNRGFTLVEMIVVLVILAILAAIITPALLGYIDEAKNKQYLLDAKNLFNATQSKLSEIYAERGTYQKVRNDPTNSLFKSDEPANNVVENGRGLNADLAYVQDYSFSRDIFKLAGYDLYDPHPDRFWYQKNADDNTKGPVWNISSGSEKDKVSFLCVGVGHYGIYAGSSNSSDVHKAYTAYFMIYQPYEGANYYLFDGTKFIDEWPYKTKISTAGKNSRFKYKTKVNGEEITIQFLVLKTVTNLKDATADLNKIDAIYFP